MWGVLQFIILSSFVRRPAILIGKAATHDVMIGYAFESDVRTWPQLP
jgi:hypothetical protein